MLSPSSLQKLPNMRKTQKLGSTHEIHVKELLCRAIGGRTVTRYQYHLKELEVKKNDSLGTNSRELSDAFNDHFSTAGLKLVTAELC